MKELDISSVPEDFLDIRDRIVCSSLSLCTDVQNKDFIGGSFWVRQYVEFYKITTILD